MLKSIFWNGHNIQALKRMKSSNIGSGFDFVLCQKYTHNKSWYSYMLWLCVRNEDTCSHCTAGYTGKEKAKYGFNPLSFPYLNFIPWNSDYLKVMVYGYVCGNTALINYVIKSRPRPAHFFFILLLTLGKSTELLCKACGVPAFWHRGLICKVWPKPTCFIFQSYLLMSSITLIHKLLVEVIKEWCH